MTRGTLEAELGNIRERYSRLTNTDNRELKDLGDLKRRYRDHILGDSGTSTISNRGYWPLTAGTISCPCRGAAIPGAANSTYGKETFLFSQTSGFGSSFSKGFLRGNFGTFLPGFSGEA